MCPYGLSEACSGLPLPTSRRCLRGIPPHPEQHAKIQQSLIAFGLLDGEADGEFGSITRSAIRRLKAQSGDVRVIS